MAPSLLCVMRVFFHMSANTHQIGADLISVKV